jgi:hypothetical protein
VLSNVLGKRDRTVLGKRMNRQNWPIWSNVPPGKSVPSAELIDV